MIHQVGLTEVVRQAIAKIKVRETEILEIERVQLKARIADVEGRERQFAARYNELAEKYN